MEMLKVPVVSFWRASYNQIPNWQPICNGRRTWGRFLKCILIYVSHPLNIMKGLLTGLMIWPINLIIESCVFEAGKALKYAGLEVLQNHSLLLAWKVVSALALVGSAGFEAAYTYSWRKTLYFFLLLCLVSCFPCPFYLSFVSFCFDRFLFQQTFFCLFVFLFPLLVATYTQIPCTATWRTCFSGCWRMI